MKKLTVIKPNGANPASPPATLDKAGANLWRTVMSEYEISDCGGREMLFQICAAADRAVECAAIIDRNGPVISTKHGLKEHPLLKIELASRSFVVRTLARLGLSVEPIKPMGRPGIDIGWTGDSE
jgi:hypothetical protein